MDIKPQIYISKVMHKRFMPKENLFNYNIYYLILPISKLSSSEITNNLAINKFGLLSFFEKDHGNKNGDLESWIRNILNKHSMNDLISDILLVTMPRVMGYVFNPVSFWLCFDKENNIRAVLCEVNNTFGETHNYLCFHEDKRVIMEDDYLEAKKIFHVSPFLKREGKYKFRFSIKEKKIAIWIDFYNQKNEKQLATSLIGKLKLLNKKSLNYTFLKHPMVTLKAIFLIHWQALKLLFKGIKYISKPDQLKQNLSKTE